MCSLWALERSDARKRAQRNDQSYKQSLSYKNTKGQSSVKNFGQLVQHLFNHKTYHRGQVSTLLSQENVDVGVTDLLLEIPESSMQ
ncbi:DinB family protein [Motiliproteus sp. MSK22-1]|uniref:DinB family protein n=1 Tax=Motiliproteus sp. MSK22-1 TaxID=1897630 RepID=UPI000976980B|nr:DinB family protein [Motiliproteus sp. MSK22-1]